MKRIILTTIIAVFSVTALYGCISMGDKKVVRYDITTQLEEGSSTKADVTRLLGKPVDISIVDGDEKWEYVYWQAPAPIYQSGMDNREKESIPAFAGQLERRETEYTKHTLTVFFTEDGVVKKMIDEH